MKLRNTIIIVLSAAIVGVIMFRPDQPTPQIIVDKLDAIEKKTTQTDSLQARIDSLAWRFDQYHNHVMELLSAKDKQLSDILKNRIDDEIKDISVPAVDSLLIRMQGPGALHSD